MVDVTEFVQVPTFMGSAVVGFVRMHRLALAMMPSLSSETRVMSGCEYTYYFTMLRYGETDCDRRLIMGEADYWHVRDNPEPWFTDVRLPCTKAGEGRATVRQPYGPVRRALDIGPSAR